MYKLGSVGRHICLGELLAYRQCKTIGKTFDIINK
jgi:cytochrome P450